MDPSVRIDRHNCGSRCLELLGSEVYHALNLQTKHCNTRSTSRPLLNPSVVSLIAFLILAAAAWIYILAGGDSGVANMFRSDTWTGAGSFVGQLLGTGDAKSPAFLVGDQWVKTGKLAYETLAMSVLAMGIAGACVLITFLPGARNVASGELSGFRSPVWRVFYLALRMIFIIISLLA